MEYYLHHSKASLMLNINFDNIHKIKVYCKSFFHAENGTIKCGTIKFSASHFSSRNMSLVKKRFRGA